MRRFRSRQKEKNEEAALRQEAQQKELASLREENQLLHARLASSSQQQAAPLLPQLSNRPHAGAQVLTSLSAAACHESFPLHGTLLCEAHQLLHALLVSSSQQQAAPLRPELLDRPHMAAQVLPTVPAAASASSDVYAARTPDLEQPAAAAAPLQLQLPEDGLTQALRCCLSCLLHFPSSACASCTHAWPPASSSRRPCCCPSCRTGPTQLPRCCSTVPGLHLALTYLQDQLLHAHLASSSQQQAAPLLPQLSDWPNSALQVLTALAVTPGLTASRQEHCGASSCMACFEQRKL